MKEKGHKETSGLRDLLKEYELTPSDRVWQGIEAAAPAPVATTPRFRPYFYGAAAMFVAAALFVVIHTLRHGGSNDMESVDIFIEQQWSGDDATATDPFAEADPLVPAETSDAPSGEAPVSPLVVTATQVSSDGARDGSSDIVRGQPAGSGTPATGNSAPLTEAQRSRTITAGTITPAGGTPPPVVTPHSTPEMPAVVPVEVAEELPAEDLVKWEVPNAFIPNHDGTNDYFRPVILNGAEVTDFRMQIYTRSGNLLFESYHIDNGWDGRYNSAPMPRGVYIWVISFRDTEGKAYARRGHLTLLR